MDVERDREVSRTDVTNGATAEVPQETRGMDED